MGRVSSSGLGSLTQVLPSFSYLSGRSQKPRIYFSWVGDPSAEKVGPEYSSSCRPVPGETEQCSDGGEQQAGRHAGLSQGGGNWEGRQG